MDRGVGAAASASCEVRKRERKRGAHRRRRAYIEARPRETPPCSCSRKSLKCRQPPRRCPAARRRSRPRGSTSSFTGRSRGPIRDRKSTRLNSSHLGISYAVFCLKKKKNK